MGDKLGTYSVENLFLSGGWREDLVKTEVIFVKMNLVGCILQNRLFFVAWPHTDTNLNRILRFGIHLLTVINNKEDHSKLCYYPFS